MYSSEGACSTASTLPSSTIRPWLITATRWAIERDQRQVVGDEQHGQAKLALQLAQQIHDGGLNATRPGPM